MVTVNDEDKGRQIGKALAFARESLLKSKTPSRMKVPSVTLLITNGKH